MNHKKKIFIFTSLPILTQIADRLLYIIVPMWLLERSFSATEIGAIFSVAAFIMIFVKFLMSKLSDRWGRKRIIITSLIVSGISATLYPSASRIYEFAAIRFFRKAGHQISKSIQDAMIGDKTSGEERVRILALFGFSYPFGRAMAMVAGIIITTFFAVVYGFYAAALSLFMAAFIILVFYDEKDFVKSRRKIISSHGITKPILIVSITHFFTFLAHTLTYSPAFFVLSKSMGLVEQDLFYIFLPMFIIGAIFSYKADFWIKRHGKEKTLAFCLFAFGLMISSYSIANSVALLFTILITANIFYYVSRVSYRNTLLDLTDDERRGEQTGTAVIISDAAMIVGPIMGGLLIDMVSLQSAFIAAGISAAIGGLIALYLRRYG